MFDLSGRVALVTGAGQGVGAGIAAALAGQGAAVAVNDLYAERAAAVVDAIHEAGGRAAAVAADVTDPDAVQALVAESEQALGPVDILVNNAGIPASGIDLRPFRDTPVETWDRLVRLNLYGVLHCTRAVLDGMCERGWGRIVIVSSEAARHGTHIGISLYGAAKAGAVGFARHLATEVGGDGVTVNCVSLGIMELPGMSERMIRRYPTGRVGRPSDVAGAVCYLASDEAAWVTGQNLPVNGGVYTG